MTGRPSSFSQEIADTICERLAEGESLRAICTSDDMPDKTTVRRWLIANELFRTQYAQARIDQAEEYAERIVDESVTATDAALGRLRMDALKWAASKLAPKRYGDAVQMKHTGEDGGPVRQVIEWAQTEAEAIADPSNAS